MVEQLRTRALFRLALDFDKPISLKNSAGDGRLVYRTDGGHFAGERLSGRIHPAVGDWVSVQDRDVEIDVRLRLETDDGAIIHMSYNGVHVFDAKLARLLLDGDQMNTGANYFRVSPRFETRSEKYAWINTVTCLGIGDRTPTGVKYEVFEVL